MVFRPGQSGRPAGRDYGAVVRTSDRAGTLARVRELASQHAAEAVEKLAELMRSAQEERLQLAACRELLVWSCGKPGEWIDVRGLATGQLSELDQAALPAQLAMLRRVVALKSRQLAEAVAAREGEGDGEEH